MKITIDKRKLAVLTDRNGRDIREYPIGELLTDFLSLDRDEVLGIISDSITLEAPKSRDEVKENVDMLYDMAGRLTQLHPYFNYIYDILISEKESIDRYGFMVSYGDAQNEPYQEESEDDDIYPLMLEHDDTYFDYSDTGIMNWFKHQISREFMESYDYYMKAVNFIFNLNGKSPGNDDETLKRYYMYNEYSSSPPRRSWLDNSVETDNDPSQQHIELENLADNELQARFDSYEYIDNFYSAGSLSGMLNLELLILAENKAQIRRCKNCGRLFPHLTGYEGLYCHRKDSTTGRSCSLEGPRRVSKERMKSDPILKEYNKAYSRNYKAYKQGRITETAYRKWLARAQSAKEDVKNGIIKFHEYKIWLDYFEFY
ncbi:DUF6076 domain-containing protein [Gudongella oleilytica]|uniref:DUF6076 domain-containing protein n=1 Tax=Gudongella oleilytica TaxID=1582259 RepID=UPI002A358AAD|nr:DUF6076 domain-containing protein [Gudongella oleilytica]MDY0257955.1 DUF6076 domain-containing protein [Gudongella oleilytica]